MTPAANTTGDQMDSSPACESNTSACNTSRLLSLPRELRDLIYKIVVEDSKTSLRSAQNASRPQHSILTPAVYATTSAMVHVNKQLREEFSQLLCSAPEITANAQISEALSLQHIIEMVESWITLPSGLIARCPAKITVNFVLHDWDEFMLHAESYRENKRTFADSLRKWVRALITLSKSSNAPQIVYNASGTSEEINHLKWTLRRLASVDEDTGFKSQRVLILDDVMSAFEKVTKLEMDDYHRAVALRQSANPLDGKFEQIWGSTGASTIKVTNENDDLEEYFSKS